MTNWSVVSEIDVKSNGVGVKKFRFIEGEKISIFNYEAIRLVGKIFAIKYDDSKILDIEVIEENGDSITLASLVLNEETEQLVDKLAGMSALELLVNLAKYRSGEL